MWKAIQSPKVSHKDKGKKVIVKETELQESSGESEDNIPVASLIKFLLS